MASTSAYTTKGKGEVMGVINVTPDSFFPTSRSAGEEAVRRAREMAKQGAAIVDIGGESTRPRADLVALDEEIRRVVPVIEQLDDLGVPISVDTRHEAVARAAVTAGASIINDVSASLGHVAAELGVGWVALHMQGTPQTMQDDPRYDDVVAEVLDYLVTVADDATRRGASKVWIDPGVGFGKTVEHNLDLIASIDRFVASEYPVLLAVSRKGFIGRSHARADGVDSVGPEDRLTGSLTIAAWGFLHGVQVVRAHDVPETVAIADKTHYLAPQDAI